MTFLCFAPALPVGIPSVFFFAYANVILSKALGDLCGGGASIEADKVSRAADRRAVGCVSLAPRFIFQTLGISDEIFLKLVVIHTTWL